MRTKYSNNEWVNKWYNNFVCAMKQAGFNETYANLNYKVTHRILFYVGYFSIIIKIHTDYSNLIYGTVTIINTRSGRMGFSKCNPKDVFDPVIGVAIAWARYCGETIPDEIFSKTEIPISELVSGDEFYYDKKSFIFVTKSPVRDNAYIVYRQMADGSKLLSTLLAAETTLVEKI